MTFKLVSDGGASCCEWVAADGAITPATPVAFRDFMASLGPAAPMRQLRVVFNSPGGDFFAALALGRALRRNTHMWTAVGRTAAVADAGDSAAKAYRMEPGVCLSTCVLAFMGGETRDYGNNGRAGSGSGGLASVAMALDQPASVIGQASADAMAAAGLPAPGMLRLVLEGYAVEMGVDPAIAADFESAVQPGGIHVFSYDEADRLSLATPLLPYTKWDLSVLRGGLVLYGTGKDRWTAYKVSLKCLSQQQDGLEYSIAFLVDLGTRSAEDLEQAYRNSILGVQVAGLSDSTVPAGKVAVQILPLQPLPATVPRWLLLTTWLDHDQVEAMRRGGSPVRFVMPHSTQQTIPEVALSAHQVTDAIGLLLRECPSD